MKADRKQVTLFKKFIPDANGECLGNGAGDGCDAWASDCECLYLIDSDAELEIGDKFIFISGENYKATPKLGYFICENLETKKEDKEDSGRFFARKVVATPDQISLTMEEKGKIFTNMGKCEIEMNVFEGEGCGYRTPKLKNKKVIIHLL